MTEMENATELLARRTQVRRRETSSEARALVHRYPLTAVLAGFAIGCLVGGVTGLLGGKAKHMAAQEENTCPNVKVDG